ncbi:hypothetical protein DOTSEDRAFT_54669 [Dothistroma septosporum NZE10]|uniref:Carbohydrate kinase PfkB domain-containing protein n=1 Tax=Dothistroma septosporum (strain NZE10 / CBS 128990) TaxID=675120 RepID=N1PI24_DOTSN|nr:hypothetical protein DOTSEDRAFT_54669 [Dothistroma septosporum NZE10]
MPSDSRRNISSQSKYFCISEEIQQALHERKPVVALETTIYTHGWKYPENLALSTRLESLVRLNGGVPATIGILDGVARVGLGADEMVRLLSASGSANTLKVSRRDIGFALGLRDAEGRPLNGGTTVSGTMVLAHAAGIKVLATGGLGGVHRGADQTMDISADLTELGRTPVAVISSGCKSFLDIPKTLEYLETQGVAVATFADGRNGRIDFPAFYTRESGVKSPMVVQDELEAAKVILAQNALGLQSGLHFANPIPEQHSLPFEHMEVAIAQAIQNARDAGATGSAETPFILSKIKELTGDTSVEANRALVESNVIRGSKVAVALQRLVLEQDISRDITLTKRYDVEEPYHRSMVGPAAAMYTPEGVPKAHGNQPVADAVAAEAQSLESEPKRTGAQDHISPAEETADVFVAGSLAVDLACDYSPRTGSSSDSPELRTSNPAQIAQSLGGVGHNMARAAHLMGADVRLCSAVGDDLTGKAALEALAAAEMSIHGIKTFPHESGSRTAQYVAINDANKDLVLAMADMSILEAPSTSDSTLPDTFDNFWLPQIHKAKPSHLAIDGNWPPEYLARWLQAGKEANSQILFEPVSKVKSTGLFLLPKPNALSTFPHHSVHIATPNSYELNAMYTAARQAFGLERKDWWEVIDAFGIPHTGARVRMALATSSKLVDEGIPQQSIQLLPFIPCILTKLGPEGVLLTQILPAGDERLTSGEYAPHILSRCANETEKTIGVGGVYMRLFPAVEDVQAEDVVSVNGVGDTFAGTLLAGLAAKGNGARVEDLVDLAQRAAVLTLKSKESVNPGLGTMRLLL